MRTREDRVERTHEEERRWHMEFESESTPLEEEQEGGDAGGNGGDEGGDGGAEEGGGEEGA
jgi:hypothetical protein